ncbi:cytochrome P450 2C16-like [Lacerta agilis]|uniref:cytochrome P450 2C16-like n=1 Tax=Lacerta agilis TaxID=80427 RepID=UPI0014194E08|nr:cytochrome P450 2C16-like [Lacerta agilis]
MESVTEAAIIFLFVLFLFFFTFLKMYQKQDQLPPGPTPWPLLGNILQKDVLQLSQTYPKFIKKYGPMFTVWMGTKPMIVLCGYETVKDALVNYAEEFGGQSPIPFFTYMTKDRGLITTNEMKWKELRKFTMSTLRNFGMGKKTMAEQIQEEAKCLVEAVEATQGQNFDPSNHVLSAVANVICSVLFGSRYDYKDQDFQEYLCILMGFLRFFDTFSAKVCNFIPKIMDYLPGQHKRTYSDLEKVFDLIRQKVEFHRQTLDAQNPRDYIDCFLIRSEKEPTFTNDFYTTEDLVMTVFVLFQGGTASTTQALLLSFLLMTKFPHIQAKVQQEIDDVIGTNRCPSMEDRMRLPFTNAVVHEILRYELVSINPAARMMTQPTKFRGYTIPQNTAVLPVIVSVLFDPMHWETPEKFNPGHFLNTRGEFRMRDAFMPFSAGKRACPGESLAQMELFLFFSTLLQNFTFQLVGDQEKMDIKSVWSDYCRNGGYPQLVAIRRFV